MTNKEKFLALVSKEETKTIERAKARLAQKSYSKLSNAIAFEILERLDELSWKQKELAEKMGVTPQQVNKWVKGNENFTIDTLAKLSEVLGIELIRVITRSDAKWAGETQLPVTKMSYDAVPFTKSITPVVKIKAVI